jgi:Uma2 family endonuclease
MATITSVPVEEYLRTTYEPDAEYVDGQLVERNVGEYLHSMLQGLIIGVLVGRARERRFRTLPECRVRVSDAPRYRIPDVSVKAIPHETDSILTCPDLAIEIMSPDDAASDLPIKIGDYLAAGIPHIWVIDPYKRTVVEADRAGIRQVESCKPSTPLVGEIDFAALFAQLDEAAK